MIRLSFIVTPKIFLFKCQNNLSKINDYFVHKKYKEDPRMPFFPLEIYLACAAQSQCLSMALCSW